jgi:hypothetical protein
LRIYLKIPNQIFYHPLMIKIIFILGCFDIRENSEQQTFENF